MRKYSENSNEIVVCPVDPLSNGEKQLLGTLFKDVSFSEQQIWTSIPIIGPERVDYNLEGTDFGN